ncbi:UNVERIFIED_CONTAM: hypothetical protein PYX00_006480 [Menopon gallinae]|uniref:General transcription factor 3C polypeptide 5 n=1 Tax=Menopon gallinae TaxID=328185 RepID=A0AAW2HWV8_9NEOP
MEINKDDINRNLVSIHYPGVVKNEEKALETLGGIRVVSSIYCGKNRRLELRMRPDDVFCKPAFATKWPVTALVLKIKFKKKKKEIVSCDVIGHVTEEYRFTSLCDFQYIPTSKTESLYNKVVPRDLDLGWFKGECPFFLQPAAFSRMDTVQNFNFSKVIAEESKPNVIGRLKRKRYGCTKCITFENPEVPDGPKNAPSGVKWPAKIVTKQTLDKLMELFSTRPIYSKAAISGISKLPSDQLRCLLPCVAYFFSNGPWRSLWVRFGYDPRKDPSSRIYQTLDYRAKSDFTKEEKHNIFKKKRESIGSPLSIKYANQANRSAAIISRNLAEVVGKDEKVDIADHIFKPGVIPPARQCLYQYCDLHVPEIQSMLENLPMVDEQATCNEVHGWLPAGMSESCREVMNKYIAEEVRRRSELSLPTAPDVNARAQVNRFSGSESESSSDA